MFMLLSLVWGWITFLPWNVGHHVSLLLNIIHHCWEIVITMQIRQAGRPMEMWGHNISWHFTLTSSTSKHCVRVPIIAITDTDTGNFVESCLCLVTGWRPLLHDCCSRGPLRGPASQGSSGHYLPAVCRCVCPLPTQTIKSGCQLGAIYGLLQKNNTAI